MSFTKRMWFSKWKTLVTPWMKGQTAKSFALWISATFPLFSAASDKGSWTVNHTLWSRIYDISCLSFSASILHSYSVLYGQILFDEVFLRLCDWANDYRQSSTLYNMSLRWTSYQTVYNHSLPPTQKQNFLTPESTITSNHPYQNRSIHSNVYIYIILHKILSVNKYRSLLYTLASQLYVFSGSRLAWLNANTTKWKKPSAQKI